MVVSNHDHKTYLDLPYRRLLDVLYEIPRIARILHLEVSRLPDFTTVCARMQELKMAFWRDLIRLSSELHETGEVQAIDEAGKDPVAASHQYAIRTNYTFRAVKTTALLDSETDVILNIHCSMNNPHDSKVAWQLLIRKLDKLNVLTAGKLRLGVTSA